MTLSSHDASIMEDIIKSSRIDFEQVSHFEEDKVKYKENNNVLFYSVHKGHVNSLEIELRENDNRILYLANQLEALRVLKIYINDVEKLNLNFINSTLSVLRIFIYGSRIITNVKNFLNLYELTIIGLDQLNEPLLEYIDIKSMPNIKKIFIEGVAVKEFRMDWELTKDIDMEIDHIINF